jgi:HAD superfamily hydrolase (TIGR01459 family)
VAERYDLILCDVFGVLHDAERTHPAAIEALARARRRGRVVVLISNSALPGPVLRDTLKARNIGPDVYDAVVTSADVTRGLLRDRAVRRVCHIGSAQEAVLFEGLDVALTQARDAEIIICTGFESPADEDRRAVLLETARALDLTLVCTNPDRSAQTPSGVLRFAGLIADAYRQLGGRVTLTGKPDRSIYLMALAAAERIRGRATSADRVLAIGDTCSLDIVGAVRCGFDAVWIGSGREGDVRRTSKRPHVMWMADLAW